MTVQTPDILTKVDRTPGVLEAVNQVSSMPGDDAAAGVVTQTHAGDTFAQALNRRMAAKGAGGVSSGASSGEAKSFAELLNHQKTAGLAAGLTDESAMAPGESAIGFLNRRHQATVNHKTMGTASTEAAAKAVAQRAVPGRLGQGARVGETAAQTLNRKKASDPVTDRHTQAEKAAEGLVSNALILPVLKQLRRSTLSEKGVFSPGTGEKTFGPEFDMQLANRIAQSPHLAIKESLVKRLENRPAPVTQASGSHKSSNAAPATSRIDVNG